jgi:hypothetical protein
MTIIIWKKNLDILSKDGKCAFTSQKDTENMRQQQQQQQQQRQRK